MGMQLEPRPPCPNYSPTFLVLFIIIIIKYLKEILILIDVTSFIFYTLSKVIEEKARAHIRYD